MRGKITIAGAAALAAAGSASANPEGAPWGSANPAAAQNCASCHFDGEAVTDSESISIFHNEAQIAGGQTVDLYIQFKNPDNQKAGFQIISSAGKFSSEYQDIEANGAQARSVAPRNNASWPEMVGTQISSDVVMWKLRWTPPEKSDDQVTFWIAVNESNDDQSPFGDQVHFKTIVLSVSQNFRLLPPL